MKFIWSLHTPPITLGELQVFKVLVYNILYKKIPEAFVVIWVKLTQGTGRGTCWWRMYKYKKQSMNSYFNLPITSYTAIEPLISLSYHTGSFIVYISILFWLLSSTLLQVQSVRVNTLLSAARTQVNNPFNTFFII